MSSTTLSAPMTDAAAAFHFYHPGAPWRSTQMSLLQSTHGFAYEDYVSAPKSGGYMYPATGETVTGPVGSMQVDVTLCGVPDEGAAGSGLNVWVEQIGASADQGGDALFNQAHLSLVGVLEFNYGGPGTSGASRLTLSVVDHSTGPPTITEYHSGDFTIANGSTHTLKMAVGATTATVTLDGTHSVTGLHGGNAGYGTAGLWSHFTSLGGASTDTLSDVQGFALNNFSWTYDTTPAPGGDPAQALLPATATIHPGQTVHFTTNNPAYFGVVGNSGNNTGGAATTGGGSGRTIDGGTGASNSGQVYPDAGIGSNASDTGVTYIAKLGAGSLGTHTITAVDAANPANTATAVVTVVPVVVDIPALSAPFAAFLYGPHGTRKPLRTDRIRQATWTDERYGGWTQFSIDLNVTLENPGEASIASQNDRIELWFYGQRRYRGFVSSVVVVEDDPPVVTISGYGIAFQASKPTVNHALVYAQPTDISRVFADVVQEYVTPLFPTLTIQATPVGVTTQQVESTYKSVADVLNDLTQNQGENLALWGGDADDNGNDRLYIKPFSSITDWAISVPGSSVTAGQRQTQSADVVNRLTILGGNPRYPNLIYNSSFERPQFSGDGEGNILLNASFEDATSTAWTGSGGYVLASPTEGNAYTGSQMWRTQGVGSNGVQTQNPSATPIVPGWDYTVAVQARWEANLTFVQGLITIHWLNAGGTILQTDSLDTSTSTLAPIWRPFSFVSRAPAGATGYTFEIKTSSMGGVGDGILWDAVEVAPVSIIYQDKWEVDAKGSATINRLNWAYKDGIDGGFCTFADISASDDDADEASIQQVTGTLFDVTPSASYTASAYFKSPPGVSSNGAMRIEVQQFDSAGNQVVIDHINIAAGSGWAAWTQEYGTITIDPTATKALLRIVWRGASSVLMDAVCFRDSGAAFPGSTGGPFIRDGQFTAQIAADNELLLGVSSAAIASIGLYGYRDTVVTVDSISDFTDALAYAKNYFNVHAPAYPLPTVTVVNDRRFFRPGQNVRLIGRDGTTMMDGQANLPIVKIDWTWNGLLSGVIQMQKELPDLASLLKKAVSGASSGGSGGSSSFTATTGGTAPGGTVSSPPPVALVPPLPATVHPGSFLFTPDGLTTEWAYPLVDENGAILTDENGLVVVAT